MTAGDVRSRFRRWRHHRPFWGSFFFLISGIELFWSANQSIGGLTLHLGPTGFLSYLIPLILLLAGLLCMFSPAQRLFYGIIGLLAALYSFIGLNLGGFFLGMIFGIVGGALVMAWGPPRVRPAAASDPETIEPDETSSEPAQHAPLDAQSERIEVAGHDDRPAEDAVRPAVDLVPGFDESDPEQPRSRSRLTRNPKALSVGVMILGVTAAMLSVGSRIPAGAATADCPSGLPSRSYATSSPSSDARSSAPAAKIAAKSPARKPQKHNPSKPASPATKPAPGGAGEQLASPSPHVTAAGRQVVDGVKGIVGGVGNRLGLGGDQSPAPSGSPSSSPTPADSSSAPAPVATTGPTTEPTREPTKEPSPEPSKASAPPSGEPSRTSAAPAASEDIIPCLGPRVLGLRADPDDVPPVADQAGVLETDSLQMFDPTYDGVAPLTTGSGHSVRALKFSMSKAVNKPFKLTVNEANGGHTVITSNELATIGTVKFYTEKFQGKLFGLIPVTFTPDSPPPLTLPYLWFTDVTIQLDYVRCDTLTGIPLLINER